jgi:hypothetical protein
MISPSSLPSAAPCSPWDPRPESGLDGLSAGLPRPDAHELTVLAPGHGPVAAAIGVDLEADTIPFAKTVPRRHGDGTRLLVDTLDDELEQDVARLDVGELGELVLGEGRGAQQQDDEEGGFHVPSGYPLLPLSAKLR